LDFPDVQEILRFLTRFVHIFQGNPYERIESSC